MQQSSEQKERISRTKPKKNWLEWEMLKSKQKQEQKRNGNKRQAVDNFA